MVRTMPCAGRKHQRGTRRRCIRLDPLLVKQQTMLLLTHGESYDRREIV